MYAIGIYYPIVYNILWDKQSCPANRINCYTVYPIFEDTKNTIYYIIHWVGIWNLVIGTSALFHWILCVE